MVLPKYDTTGNRIAAAIIDGIIFMPLGFAEAYLLGIQYEAMPVIASLLEPVLWTLYVVIGHGKYGQTIGKKLMNIKVMDLNEQDCIGYTRAFIRESIWFSTVIASLVYWYLYPSGYAGSGGTLFELILSSFSVIWLLVEIISMLFNDKRRAIHDLMAGSVVVDVRQLEKERYYESITIGDEPV